eukprot:202192_1
MGSCTSTLQKETVQTIPRNSVSSKSNAHHKIEHPASHDNTHRPHQSDIACEALIAASFNRTLFSEDIVYEYAMHCNILDTFNQPLISSWTLRLTVEDITAFYLQTLSHYDGVHPHDIPDQFGKVMNPNIFSSLLAKILSTPGLLNHTDPSFAEATARFLSIPYDIRSILQYDPQEYTADMNTRDAFKYCKVICQNLDKYKYLCCNTSVYHDVSRTVSRRKDPHNTPMSCDSYWLRSLHDKVDLLVSTTADNVMMITLNDVAFNIAQVLKHYCDLDDLLAWIITDYLPKYVVFNHPDERCNAQIIYKYDPRHVSYDADGDEFYLQEMGNELLKRHPDLNADELNDFCVDMRCQHMSIAASLPRISSSYHEESDQGKRMMSDVSVSEYTSITKCYASEVSAMSKESHHEIEEKSCQSTVSQYIPLHHESVDKSEVDEDKYRCFFSAFIDEEGDDDINMFQWMTSLQKLNINLSEKQICDAFNVMLEANEDSEGYIDFVDFTHFCQLEIDDHDANVRRTQQMLNSFIL